MVENREQLLSLEAWIATRIFSIIRVYWMDKASEDRPLPALHEVSFRSFIELSKKGETKMDTSCFVKKVDIPKVTIYASAASQKDLAMVRED